MSSLPQAHTSEEPLLPEGAPIPEISGPIADLDNAKNRKEAKEILNAVAKVEVIRDEFGVLFPDHPIVQHYLKTLERLPKEDENEARAKETRQNIEQAVKPKKNDKPKQANRHPRSDKRNKASSKPHTMKQADKKDLALIPTTELQSFGLFEGKTGSVTEAEAIEAAKALEGERRMEALQAIPDLKRNALINTIKGLVAKTKGANTFDHLRSLERQIAEMKEPAIGKDAELRIVLEQRKKVLGDQIRQFDAVAQLPNSARFYTTKTFNTPKGPKTIDFNYAIEYILSKDSQRVLVAQCVSERPDAPKLDVSTTNYRNYENLPKELKDYVFGLNRQGKIFLRGGEIQKQAQKPSAPKAKTEPQAKPATEAKPSAPNTNEAPSETDLETKELAEAIKSNPELKIVRDALYALKDRKPEKILPGMTMEQLDIIVRKATGILDPDLGDDKDTKTPKGLRDLVEMSVSPSSLDLLARDLNKLINEAKIAQRKAA